ncbi:MAG TPA: glycosyltransferase [Candidatus Acidoferrum sp.]|nr:glycosyltransferase [Candidatus Acidoferrum sp.]
MPEHAVERAAFPRPAQDSHAVPLLSICIPTLNRAEHLKGAISSLASQLGSDVEVIVCDTGSTDGTRELMKEMVACWPTIRYLRREEILGVDETLLLLLAESRGAYVWFFGSDDVLKPGAIDKIRRRIVGAPEPPAMVYLNHEIMDSAGKVLISSQFVASRDRRYMQGWRAVPRLGIKLGYISACIVRRENLLSVDDAADFVGSRWVSLHLYLSALRVGGALEFVAEPLVRARRNPSACSEYAEVFVRQAARVFAAARRTGYPRHTIFRTMNSIVAGQYLRFVVSWRAENPAELARTFPAMFETCWMYPAFWLFLIPARVAPQWIVRAVRNQLRAWRQKRSARRDGVDAARELRAPIADL